MSKSTLNRCFTCALLVSLSSGVAQAQESRTIKPGTTVTETLGENETHSYTIDLEEDSFVMGAADQLTLDVIVKIYSPDDRQIAQIDGPARGPERFQFDTSEPGAYRIEILPFEDQTGDYTLGITRAEPIASEGPARVDQLMAAYDNLDTPGGVVAVVRDGDVIFARAYGMADLSHHIPFEIDTRTNIGSTTKQFTAFGICLLAERAELSLDDDIRIHIPELPDHGKIVTIRNLLTPTSGYREFLNFFALSGRQLGEGDFIARDEIVEMLKRQPELQNEPGGEWNYNNSGYVLATIVIENVGGKPFGEWMDENVFTPLGMDDTFVQAHRSNVIDRKARGYVPAEDAGYREGTDLGGAMGAGGIYTTVGDLALWIDNLHTQELGGTSAIDQMTTRFVLNSGDPTGYGLGLFLDEQRGLERIQHGGADTAHRSMIMYFPTINAGVITQSNNASFDGTIANKVAEAFFADEMEPVKEEPEGEVTDEFDLASYDPESFDALAGRYELEEVAGFIITFTREDDKIYAQATGQPKFEVTPTSKTSFKFTVVEASIQFHVDDDGTCSSLTLHQNGEHKANRVEEEPWAPSEDQLASYAGRYFSEELETFYELIIEDDKLVIHHRRFEVTLDAGEEHLFRGGFPVAELTFLPDENGHLSAFTVSNGRTRGVRFERVH